MSTILAYAQMVADFVRDNPHWMAPVVFALAFGESLAFLSLFLPSTVILAVISGMLGSGPINYSQVALLVGLAWMGGVLGYWISYWLSYRNPDKVAKYDSGVWNRAQAFFDKWGAWAVFFGHFFGPVRAVIPVVAGVAGLAPWKFHLANLPSAFLWAAGVLVLPLFGVNWFLQH